MAKYVLSNDKGKKLVIEHTERVKVYIQDETGYARPIMAEQEFELLAVEATKYVMGCIVKANEKGWRDVS